MASALRCLAATPKGSILKSRLLSTTRVVRNDTPANVGALPAQKKPIGVFRGGIIGFLFGFSLAASFAAYSLLDEYKQASAALQASVEELRMSTEKISEHVKRIETVEKDLKALNATTATKDEVSRVRTEMKKLYDGLHIELLDLRSHIWGIQEDLHAFGKESGNVVRV